MSTELGLKAENQAAQHLEELGMKILDRNWRNRWCEIDIVAKDKQNTIHFVEVKYRRLSNYGSGFEYITREKASRLKRAAEVWISLHYGEAAYQIDVISITGANLEYLPNAVEG